VRATAELIADGGAAAAANEFFRSTTFHRAEGVTHSLRVRSADRVAAIGVIVRAIAGGRGSDAVSAYGYPGGAVAGDGAAPSAAEVDWSPTGLVSLFARERLAGPPLLADPADRGHVLVHDPSRPRAVRRRLAEQIRQGARRGYRLETVPGPASADVDRAAFHAAYTETMRAAGAGERYFFGRGYVDSALVFERSWLILARAPSTAVAAAAIAAVSDGYLHYFLGGTADAARAESPFKLVVAAMIDLADELALPLNLGGGLAPGDGLERFKRGFANSEAPFRTHQVICDRGAYEELAGSRPAGDFFPAYRAP
jgi:GNAT acetyltransferase-like protein